MLGRHLLTFFIFAKALRVTPEPHEEVRAVTCSASDVLYAEGVPSGFKNKLADLSNHSVISLLNTGVDADALQTCYNLHREEGDWKLSWKKKLLDKAVSLGKGVIASKGRSSVLQPLLSNILDWQQPGAGRLMTWAFDHEDGMNAFCSNNHEKYPTQRDRMKIRQDLFELFQHFSHLLVSGHDEETELDPGSAMVNQTLGFLITKAIASTFVADCYFSAMTTKSRKKRLTWDTSAPLPPVVQRSFELLRDSEPTSREIYFLQQLVNLFQEYVRVNQVDLDDPEIAPEIQGLWRLLGAQTETSRVYEAAEETLKDVEPTRPASCRCSHIAATVSKALANRLKLLGFDADGADNDWLWQATELSKLLDLFTLTEEGIQDPNLSFLGLLREANRLPRLPTQQGKGVSAATAQRSIVKGVLVGLPMLQNYLAHLDVKNGGSESMKVNYAKKSKWFLFLNIAWAVWHENMQVGTGVLQRVSLRHRQQNVAMGLLVSAFAAVSQFSWDGKLFKETNTDAFNDFNVALYTVWNYRWVAALFEPRRLQFHFWHGLGLPVLQALGNEKTSAYWVNYRRDGLMAAMMNLSPLPQDDAA